MNSWESNSHMYQYKIVIVMIFLWLRVVLETEQIFRFLTSPTLDSHSFLPLSNYNNLLIEF